MAWAFLGLEKDQMSAGNFGPGYPAILAQTEASAATAGSGGASELPVAQVEGYASGTITLGGTPATSDAVTVNIANRPVTYTLTGGDTTLALAATHLATAINNDTVAKTYVTAAASGAVVTCTAKTEGVQGMVPFSCSESGGSLTATASGTELDLAGNVVVPLKTQAVTLPSTAGAITLYAGVPIVVDPASKTWLRSNGYIA